MAKKHKPPSRIKYEQNNPVVGIRLDKETRAALESLKAKTGKSLAVLIKEALGLRERELEDWDDVCIYSIVRGGFCKNEGAKFCICEDCWRGMSADEIDDQMELYFEG